MFGVLRDGWRHPLPLGCKAPCDLLHRGLGPNVPLGTLPKRVKVYPMICVGREQGGELGGR